MQIITIAIGEYYLKCAINLAASAFDKHPISVITDQELSDRERLLFQNVYEPIYVGESNLETAMFNKLSIDEYVNNEKTLFLDADTILFKKIDERCLKQFECIVLHPSIKYPQWITKENLQTYFKLSETISQNTSWIYFDGSKKTKKIFEDARSVYVSIQKNEIPTLLFRNVTVDEVCFNIAATNHLCARKSPYIPIYVPFIHFEGNIHTIDNYYGITMCGTTPKSSQVINLYNEYVSYYADKVGINNKYFYTEKQTIPTPRKKTKHNISVFFHIALMGNWKEVVIEQLSLMQLSGLYESASSIQIGCLGSLEDFSVLKSILKKFPKSEIKVYEENLKLYEFPTLSLLQNHCIGNVDDYVIYLHSKGVSYQKGAHWRAYMNHFNITLWEDCVDYLDEGYDAVGVKYIDESSGFKRHFSGNFWWASAQHIATLPKIEHLNKKDRYEAEMWLLSNICPIKNMSNVFIDYNKTPDFL